MTEMQRQFEEWAALIGINIAFDSNYQMYTDERTELDWATWQASRAAIVVKTDTMKDPSYEATGMVYLDAVEQALDDAGIGYK